MTFHALSIAGSDPSGGAGIQADLKTFQALGCYGMSAITALTAQNTQTVKAVFAVSSEFIEEQLCAIFEDIRVDAVKIGMLFSADIMKSVARTILRFKVKNVVVDPVMISKSGLALLQPEAVSTLVEHILPFATLITPNIPEARALTSMDITSEESMLLAARTLKKTCRAVLLKGGHFPGAEEQGVVKDLLIQENNEENWFTKPHVQTRNTHGTGCTYSAAIAAFLARGCVLPFAVTQARDYLQGAIECGAQQNIGKGHGPVDHAWRIR